MNLMEVFDEEKEVFAGIQTACGWVVLMPSFAINPSQGNRVDAAADTRNFGGS
ncbi:MAG: hypothetical protein AAF098_19375 [Pseudomonadota bacterium]